MKILRIFIVLLLMTKVILSFSSDSIKFGNAIYINLAVGEKFEYLGKSIEVVELKKHWSLVKVDDERVWLKVAKNSLPKYLGGLRIFVSDQINVKNLTTDPEVHNLLKKEVLLCISDPSGPLLDSSAFVFPVSKRDGYEWKMEEDSHMFAYLGKSWRKGNPNYYRSHEGIDFDMHEARGKEMHPLISIESGTVIMVADSQVTGSFDGCIILKSDTQANIYYVYKHTNPKTHKVTVGQKVKKGEMLSYIWGDNVWGHLHLAIVYQPEIITYAKRYNNLLNFSPQLYELYFGNLEPKETVRKEGQFGFGQSRENCRNFKRLGAFNKLIGYGWKLEEWCTAEKVASALITDHRIIGSKNHSIRNEVTRTDYTSNARLPGILHAGTNAECENPESFYEFEVVVSDNKLTVRLELLKKENCAGIKELNFKKIDR
jgi:hypothetical protein